MGNKDNIQAKTDRMELLYPISHDLKSPLNRILGLAQLIDLSRDKLDDEQKEYLDRIHQVTSDGLDMISSMIDTYDLEKGNFEECLQTVDIRQIITSRIQSYRDVAKIKNIEIRFDSSNMQPAEVVTDKLLLGRIIDNLLSNAIKFSPKDKKIIVEVEDKDYYVAFAVLDEGPGINKKNRERLYKKFQRLDMYPTAGETTTGLGLYVVKTIIEKINGAIECESELRKGTKFTVTVRKKPTDTLKKQGI